MAQLVSHLVCRKLDSGVPVTPDSLYARNGDFSGVEYIPSDYYFNQTVFTVTASYGEAVSLSTTWNYENRVGIWFFELPSDTMINSDGLKLFFKVAPEVYNTVFNSNNATLDYYTLPLELIDMDLNGHLSVRKDAYLISDQAVKACPSSSLSDLKSAGSNYITKNLSYSTVLRLSDGRRIVALRLAMSLAATATLPTGYNYVPILLDSIKLAVEETTIPHPDNFRLLPSATDIVLSWDKPNFDSIFGYRLDIQKKLDANGTYGIYIPGASGGLVPQAGAWASIFIPATSSTSYSVSLSSQSNLTTPYQAWSSSDEYVARVTTLVGNQNMEYSIPTYTLKGTTGTFLAPDPPRNVNIYAGNNKLHLSWDSPVSNTGCPIHKFLVLVFDVDGGPPVTAAPITVHRGEGVTIYETYALELAKSPTVSLSNGRRYKAQITSVNAIGSSLPSESPEVLLAPVERYVESDNKKYKKFYRYPVELRGSAYGEPLYAKSVVEYGDAYITSRVTYPVTIASSSNLLHLHVSGYGDTNTVTVPVQYGTYSSPSQLAEAVRAAILAGYTSEFGPIPVYVTGVTSLSFSLTRPTTVGVAELYPVSGVNSVNDTIFGEDSVVISPNRVVHVDNHIPTVEYDLAHKKCLADMKPYIPVEERFDITPATRSNMTKSDYPLSFNLRHTDIRSGSLSVTWFVNGVQEIISDTGNGFLISSPKVDACGNKISPQQLGFIDYAAGIVSCYLPEITSGYAIVKYAANKPVMDNHQYIWAPTPHFGLELHLKEPVFFGPSQWAYLNQNADRIRPGFTVLEFIDATIDLRSTLVSVQDSISLT